MKSKDIAIPCRWQVKFCVKPSLNKSEGVDGYEFEVIDRGDNKETYVTISYETDAYDEKSPDSDKYAEDIMARKYASHLQNLFLERMIYRRVFGPFEIIDSITTLQNEKELKEAGLWKNRNYGMHVEKMSIRKPSGGNSLTESHNFWKTGISKDVDGRAKDENMIYAIGELLQLAEIEGDDIMRFILTWNAFNWLYTYFNLITKSKKTKQRDMFRTIIGSLGQNEMSYIKQYLTSDRLDNLVSYNILRGKGNNKVNVSKELDDKIKNSAPDFEIIASVLTCIYGVRNQIFHEGPTSRTLTSEELATRAKICNSILMPAVTTCLKNFVNYES